MKNIELPKFVDKKFVSSGTLVGISLEIDDLSSPQSIKSSDLTRLILLSDSLDSGFSIKVPRDQ